MLKKQRKSRPRHGEITKKSPEKRKQTRKSRPRHEKYIQSCPRDGKTHIFRSAVLANILCFFDKMFMIRVAMGAVKIRIDPEASPFRGDAYFEGPGAQKNHFLNNRTVLKICFTHMFRKKRFRDIFFLKNRFRKNGVGVSLLGGGSGPKNYSSDLPPRFQKLFWSRK